MGASAQRGTPEPAVAVAAQGELNSVPAVGSERFGGPRTGPVTASSAVGSATMRAYPLPRQPLERPRVIGEEMGPPRAGPPREYHFA
jgi:hypothetical protein